MVWPSKKVLSIFVLTAALVVSVIIVFGKDKVNSAINYASNLVIGEKMVIPENPEWQNEFEQIIPYANQGGESDAGDENVTDTISRTLMSNYLAMKEAGTLDSESAQKLIDQTVEYLGATSGSFVPLTEAQLNTVADNGSATISQYGENLGNVLKGKKITDIQKELGIIVQVAQSGDGSASVELENIAAEYDGIAVNLIKMPVPKTFIKAHLDILNGARGVAHYVRQFGLYTSDPIKSLSALQGYQQSLYKAMGALQATITFIKQNNVVYKQGSSGYYLLYGI